MRGYTESNIEALQEAIADLEAKNSRAVVKMETLRKQRGALLAACKEAYEFLDDRTDTYPEPCEDVPALSVMIALKFAMGKAKGDQSPHLLDKHSETVL